MLIAIGEMSKNKHTHTDFLGAMLVFGRVSSLVLVPHFVGGEICFSCHGPFFSSLRGSHFLTFSDRQDQSSTVHPPSKWTLKMQPNQQNHGNHQQENPPLGLFNAFFKVRAPSKISYTVWLEVHEASKQEVSHGSSAWPCTSWRSCECREICRS